MHRSETEEVLPCAVCGTSVTPGVERAFGFGARAVLCFDCAVERGGGYDDRLDRWDPEPSIEGLVAGDD